MRSSSGEEDKGTYPAWTFIILQLPSHLLPLPRLSVLRGHLCPFPTVFPVLPSSCSRTDGVLVQREEEHS